MRPQFRPHGSPTRSSWGLLGNNGGACDLMCQHCFYHGLDEKVFYDAESLLCRFNKFRFYYGLTATDITGGEPMLYHDPALTERGLKHCLPLGRNEHLEYLVGHCARIGLAPSIITHGQRLSYEAVTALENLGLDTWEISIHALGALDGKKLGEGHKRLVLRPDGSEYEGGFQKMIEGSKHCKRPIRFNATVVEPTYKELPALARFLTERYAPVVFNMITMMLYYKHSQEYPAFGLKYTEVAPYIAEAVQIVEAAGWECNVRYMPPCVGHEFGFARNCECHYRIQHDWAEWALEATTDCQLPNPWSHVERGLVPEEQFWNESMRERVRICDIHARARQPHSKPCQECAARKVCEGPEVAYSRKWGTDEFKPFASAALGLAEGALAIDPMQFDSLKGSTAHASKTD